MTDIEDSLTDDEYDKINAKTLFALDHDDYDIKSIFDKVKNKAGSIYHLNVLADPCIIDGLFTSKIEKYFQGPTSKLEEKRLWPYRPLAVKPTNQQSNQSTRSPTNQPEVQPTNQPEVQPTNPPLPSLPQ
ncbi:hypothetical protein RDWZM_001730 [Blomia tropicalis]|uniref:Uncharacterized protein n=1 Tax=Blomia tropicalis TaxID=40697 RepID=A0A9Q0MC46_BLOTA|nr:hypothetical protein RDWZM_001730 [Blomia tropicalis]